jgi:gamma-glutamyltranspeptidase/glutathione hydrolase/leukotriene-C4 hydrolase
MGYILNILDAYNLRKDVKLDVADDPLTYHWITEAFKHAYAQRTKLGDPRFVPDVNEVIIFCFKICSNILLYIKYNF